MDTGIFKMQLLFVQYVVIFVGGSRFVVVVFGG